ncbi:MAG: tetratricopeptide repeat protein, partial [Epsilonproteobacteria bacterium]|nr:tetratricopeptide repeat protein [Campylobacterota bacterium]
MADTQEEIIVIEEADAAGVATTSLAQGEPSNQPDSPNKKKKMILIGGAIALLLLIGGGSLVLLFSSGNEEPSKPLDAPIAKKIKDSDEEVIEPSALENMIERANYLYTNGNQAEALKLYEKIALYSEAISQYNLGVVQLKEGDFQGALENFKRSIDNSENRCVSAINAAVCCLNLKREKDFN